MLSQLDDSYQKASISIHERQAQLAHPSKECLYDRGMEIKDWVLAARKSAGKTQQQLGDEVGRTKANVGHWEKGLHQPSWEMIQAIAAATKYPLPSDASLRNTEPGPDLRAAPSLSQALEVVAARLNELPDEQREVAAQRLQTLARAPDSARAMEALLAAMQLTSEAMSQSAVPGIAGQVVTRRLSTETADFSPAAQPGRQPT